MRSQDRPQELVKRLEDRYRERGLMQQAMNRAVDEGSRGDIAVYLASLDREIEEIQRDLAGEAAPHAS